MCTSFHVASFAVPTIRYRYLVVRFKFETATHSFEFELAASVTRFIYCQKLQGVVVVHFNLI